MMANFRRGQMVRIKKQFMECPGSAVGKVVHSGGVVALVTFNDWLGGTGTNYNEAWIPTNQLEPARAIRKIEWV